MSDTNNRVGRCGARPVGRRTERVVAGLYDPRVLAYVFWHVPSPASPSPTTRRGSRAFHDALRADAPAGLGPTATVALGAVPWLGGAAGYEDWYLVEDFAALGTLNAAAVVGREQARRTTRRRPRRTPASRG